MTFNTNALDLSLSTKSKQPLASVYGEGSLKKETYSSHCSSSVSWKQLSQYTADFDRSPKQLPTFSPAFLQNAVSAKNY